jgi:hypothetical protein
MPPKTHKEFPLLTSSETEKVFQKKESIFEIQKSFSVSEVDTIGNSSTVFNTSGTFFSFENSSKRFLRPTRKRNWVSEHSKTFFVDFSGDQNFLKCWRDAEFNWFCPVPSRFTDDHVPSRYDSNFLVPSRPRTGRDGIRPGSRGALKGTIPRNEKRS